MYTINFIFIYSFLGFVLESTYYKITNSNTHSSIFLGPYTLVYGFGMYFSFLIYKIINLPNNVFSYFIYYIIFCIITTLIEFIGGNLIHLFLNIDKWNYSNNKYHFGKYICLKNSLIWGTLVLIILLYFHPYINSHIITTIPKSFTIMLLIIFILDLLYLIKKKNK